MIKLIKENKKLAYSLYKREEFFFPLIAAVLLDEQDGVVYTDKPDSPSQVYVEHSFGFSQLFGEMGVKFTQQMEDYLLVGRAFHSEKVRLYAPQVPDFLLKSNQKVSLSQRQRFTLNYKLFLDRKRTVPSNDENHIQLCDVGFEDVNLIEDKFKVVNRFWRNPKDFIERANPCLLFYNNEPASICYAAATADGYAEIDVLTLTAYRKLGLAGYALTRFIEKCQSIGIQPLWDCFTNNAASMALANSMGFIPWNSPYSFFTINK
jgi:hypothetical protein